MKQCPDSMQLEVFPFRCELTIAARFLGMDFAGRGVSVPSSCLSLHPINRIEADAVTSLISSPKLGHRASDQNEGPIPYQRCVMGKSPSAHNVFGSTGPKGSMAQPGLLLVISSLVFCVHVMRGLADSVFIGSPALTCCFQQWMIRALPLETPNTGREGGPSPLALLCRVPSSENGKLFFSANPCHFCN